MRYASFRKEKILIKKVFYIWEFFFIKQYYIGVTDNVPTLSKVNNNDSINTREKTHHIGK